LEQIQKYTLSQIENIPPRLFELSEAVQYPVGISQKVKNLLKQVVKEHAK
jgi:hypothetical protein